MDEWDIDVCVVAGGHHLRTKEVFKRSWIESRKANHKIWFFWLGEGEFVSSYGRVRVRPGLFVALPPDEDYRLQWSDTEPLGYYSIRFDVMQGEISFPFAVAARDMSFAEAAMKRVADLEDNTLAGELLRVVLLDLHNQQEMPMDGAPAAEHARRQAIEAIALRIARDPSDAQDVDRLAAEAGYTRQHFTNLFKQVMGVAPKRYALSCRINQAWELLQATTLSIKEIAHRLGFHSSQHFSAQFKKETGLSPSKLRDRHAMIEPGN